MNTKPLPFESGRSLLGQVTEKRMNAIVRSIPRLRFSGGGVRVSYLGDQVFVEFPSTKVPSQEPHDYTVYDASVGSTPMIGVTPGTHNGVTPTLSGSPLTAIPPPALTLSGGETLVYFQIDYDSSGNITSIEILGATSLPTPTIVPGSAGSDYKKLSTITITTVGSVSTVKCFNDVVSGPQGYLQCGTNSSVWLV